MRIKWLLVLCLFAFSGSATAYQKAPRIEQKVWDYAQPYFLPEDHPVKAKLDKIFAAGRRTLMNEKSLVGAGFKAPKQGHHMRRPYVLKHKELNGYLVKMFTEDNDANEWQQWVRRVKGAQYTLAAINELGYENLFSVPDKWIYPIPDMPGVPTGKYPKNFVLVVQDMKILKGKDNKKAWKSMAITPSVLDALYIIVTKVGLADSLFVFNIPFSRIDGRISFIDTEDYHLWPIEYERMKNFLNDDMSDYWDFLMEHNGPKK